jgi:hypothetical protein
MPIGRETAPLGIPTSSAGLGVGETEEAAKRRYSEPAQAASQALGDVQPPRGAYDEMENRWALGIMTRFARF